MWKLSHLLLALSDSNSASSCHLSFMSLSLWCLSSSSYWRQRFSRAGKFFIRLLTNVCWVCFQNMCVSACYVCTNEKWSHDHINDDHRNANKGFIFNFKSQQTSVVTAIHCVQKHKGPADGVYPGVTLLSITVLSVLQIFNLQTDGNWSLSQRRWTPAGMTERTLTSSSSSLFSFSSCMLMSVSEFEVTHQRGTKPAG